MRRKRNENVVLKFSISLVVIVAILVACYLVFNALGFTSLTKEELQAYIQDFGALAPIAFIAVSFLQVTFVPIPGMVTILAGNYLFGAWRSFLYSYIGMMLGSIFAFLLGRLIGKPFVNWLVGSEKTVDNYLKRLKGRENVLLFFMFLFPLFPDDILCSIAGLCPLTFLGFILMQIVTRATSIGATLLFLSGEVIPYNAWGIPIIAVLLVLGVVAFIVSMKNAEKINKFVSNLAIKVSDKFKKDNKKQEDKIED